MMKGYLRSGEGVFPLAPKVTTIGREECDLNIQAPNIEQRHAVIEHNEAENCFVLQDLNTAHGTYVNDCRVQNAAVRLAPGDVIRFGYSGIPHELEIDNAPQVNYPPVQQRPGFNQPLTLSTDNLTYSSESISQLPYLVSTTASAQPTWTTSAAPQTTSVMPRPPMSTRTRPASAGARRPSQGSSQGSPVDSPVMKQKAVMGGWVSGSNARTVVTTTIGGSPVIGSPAARASPTADVLLLHEKEQRLQRMGDEINRLAVFESESHRKDSVIAALRNENEELQKGLAQKDQQNNKDSDNLTQKLVIFESELATKKLEIHALKEQMSHMRLESQDPNENPAMLRTVILERERELTTVKQDLDRMKREKGTSQTLVTTLQRDVSNKDSAIRRLNTELEKQKREIREKDVSLSAMSAKFSRMKENKRHEEEMQSREKELISLKHKLKGAENKIAEQIETMVTYKDEIERVKQLLEEQKSLESKFKAEVEHGKSQFLDIQRSERLVKVDLEQAQKRLDRFRNRVVQQTFCAPGIKAPDNTEDVNDDELIDTIKLLIDDRTEARNKVRELKDTIKIQETSRKDSNKSVKAMKQHMEAAKTRLSNSGRSSGVISQEIKLLQSVTADESQQWTKDGLLAILTQELAWQQEIEDALEKCGFNVKSSDQVPGKYIESLNSRLETVTKEKEDIKVKITTIEQDVRSEMTGTINDIKHEHEMKLLDAIEKVKAEDDQKLHQMLEEVRIAEAEKKTEAVESEKAKLVELEKTIDGMREAIGEKGDEDKKYMTVISELETQIEDMRQAESKLKEELLNQEIKLKDEMKELRERHEEEKHSHYTEIASYKEQVRQHAVTILAMEQRLVMITRDHKEVQDERTQLKEEIDKLKSRPISVPAIKPEIAPKPVIVQAGPEVQALEQLVQVLRREAADFKKEIQDQQDVILGLRRDLAGASARLSDMTGELSEHQKQEMEGNRTVMKDMENELITQRQQMAKLSELVDKQSAEVKKLQDLLSAERQLVGKMKEDISVKSGEIVQLESQLKSEQETQRQSVATKEQEGVIASELASTGAQCRGERHEQVIARQREALAELRSRIKGLEKSSPPIPSHDQALQQVVLLKKELAEMRAQQASITDGSVNLQDAILGQKVAEARGQIPPAVSDSAIERSARIETQEALAESEKSYMELAKAIANQLDLGEIHGLRSVTHLPRDERERLTREREKAIELMVSRLRVLHQRLDRKDELLQDYEKDLARLRQAEHVANEKAIQVETLATDVRSRVEENQYLRETLRRTRETLEQEKRLNTAIKNKKTFHMEKDEKNVKTWPRHNCYHDDTSQKKDKKKKEQKDTMLRKSYEIESLKTELTAKDQQLCDTTARLINLENSMTSPGRDDMVVTTTETIESYHTHLE